MKLLLRLGVGQRLLEKGVEYRSFEYYSASGRRLNGLSEGEVADTWGLRVSVRCSVGAQLRVEQASSESSA